MLRRTSRPRRIKPAHILTSARPRVVVVLVGHAVVVLEAELGKVRCDLDADKRLANEVLVHAD